jgi:protein disulfide-isomerase A1
LLKPVAKKYKEYLSFVTVDAVEYGHMLPALGHKKGDVPAVSVFNPMYGQVFPFGKKRGKVTAQSVEGFVLDIVNGKVMPGVDGGNGEKVGIVHDEM